MHPPNTHPSLGRRISLLAGIVFSLITPAAAQSLITSPEPEAVSLTVYRGQKQDSAPIDPNWPTGYALITETRTVTIPAGESVIRFEGVAEGMFPESAIVTGLPKGVKEKNRDARLLSPTGLIDAYLKREVRLTRTDRATGNKREQQAIITAGPTGGVIVQTAEGFEALHCTGLPERMGFAQLPANLSAKPTLSVITHADMATTARLTLTYMAAGFDWQANYVAQVQEDKIGGKGGGREKIDIFAWLTLANGGNQSFVNANTMAIAGAPNRVARGAQPRPTGGSLQLKCWPMQRTHQIGHYPAPPPPPPPMALYAMADAENIVVTASRIRGEKTMAPVAVVVAEQEDLGDLKLYRIPEPVTVNAKGQKQVAMIVKPGAAFDRLYTASVDTYFNGDSGSGSQPMTILFRGENRKEKGLGLPMPQGQVMMFEASDYGPLLAGEAVLADRAVGDVIEMAIGQSSDVRFSVTRLGEGGQTQRFKIDIINARSEAVNIEVEIPYELRGKPKAIAKIDGVPTWKTTVPANGEAAVFYELRLAN